MSHKGGKAGKGRTRKAARTASAIKLAEERAKRSPKEQIAHLDKLLGNGVGAKRERARLQEQIKAAEK
jgi:hypothetical protein